MKARISFENGNRSLKTAIVPFENGYRAL